jgi:bifunctional UDP-N-acetylglucosamine pyrophosphorylase/glucosamine-1-phosphate N-acetyltransferase
MLHTIWNVPTVERVFRACANGEQSMNLVIVVGIKAEDVMSVVGKRERLAFSYQAEQKGTGHAVQVGLEKIDDKAFKGTVYVLPGDMGLINRETISMFRDSFRISSSDMMVLTGQYEGDVEYNNYGRILRVKDKDTAGSPSGEDEGNVIEILEAKDIRALKRDEMYITEYKGKKYAFSKKELIHNREFNSGVYAFNYARLLDLVYNIDAANAQNEFYITDLIGLFNKNGYSVGAVSPEDETVVMGFNDKAVLRQMEAIYRRKTYERIKNIVDIDYPDNFFIDDSVVEQIIAMDKEGKPLDIKIAQGVHIGAGVKLNYNLTLGKNAYIDGNVEFGENVTVYENTHLSTFPHQKFVIGNNVEILWGDIIKGNIVIGDNSRIESSVNMTGSDDFPLRIGKNVLIKGTSYIFGSVIENDISIEHSVIIKKKVVRLVRNDGNIQPVRYYLPLPTGVDIVEDL